MSIVMIVCSQCK